MITGGVIALLMPAFIGVPMLWTHWSDAHPAARVGYGYLIGTWIITLVLWLWGVSGLPYAFTPLAAIFSLGATALSLSTNHFSNRTEKTSSHHERSAYRWLWWLLLFLLTIRFGSLLLEVILRPLYPWDAWTNWAPKAKIWFSLQEWTPFVHREAWPAESIANNAYTLTNPRAVGYPSFVPLTQLWMALGLGEWRDNLINLPWWFGVSAFGLAFYGQLRTLTVKPGVSMIATYLLLSIPYLNAHIALAGYAELWMAAFYCAAVMSLINWNLTGSHTQLLLALLMGIACVFIKNPGIVWATTLLPGIMIGLFPAWLRYLSLSLSIIGIALLVYAKEIIFSLPSGQEWIISTSLIQIPGIGSFPLEFHPVGEFFLKNDLVFDNWHLLGWLLLVLTPIGMLYASYQQRLRPGLAVMVSGIIFIFIVFFFTTHYHAAINSTTINRATFHLIPALFYFSVVALSVVRSIEDNPENKLFLS